ncbi:MAG: sigma-70 family RNA polymerase sigma factor [Actinomycetota bacterium]|nr:sigma-70 family RNA polymerase sigma factor [Actinomycetota bacterium]
MAPEQSGIPQPSHEELPAGEGRLGADDCLLVRRLRNRDEGAFVEAIRALGPTLLRVARLYVRSDQVAEEVVQETWINVLESLDRFEGRSSFKTWVLTILVHTALRRGQLEARSSPFSAVIQTSDSTLSDDRLDLDRFFSGDHPRWPHCWATVVPRLDQLPEEQLLSAETMRVVNAAIADTPDAQAAVLVLHDIEGWPPDEICRALELSDGNRRLLLHRARNRIRAALEQYFDESHRADA